jgi:hypothetical protein
LALCGCASLTAEAPLFSPRDPSGPPPLTEGIWIGVTDDCPASNARRQRGRFPAGCTPVEIRRTADGAWTMNFRADLVANLSERERAETPDGITTTIAPVTALTTPDSYAALYVAEYVMIEDGQTQPIAYAVLAPLGEMPARQMLIIPQIGCFEILIDGPIEGVNVRYTPVEVPSEEPKQERVTSSERRQIESCVATTQAAVREAARRAMIENLDSIDDGRLVYVRQN